MNDGERVRQAYLKRARPGADVDFHPTLDAIERLDRDARRWQRLKAVLAAATKKHGAWGVTDRAVKDIEEEIP